MVGLAAWRRRRVKLHGLGEGLSGLWLTVKGGGFYKV